MYAFIYQFTKIFNLNWLYIYLSMKNYSLLINQKWINFFFLTPDGIMLHSFDYDLLVCFSSWTNLHIKMQRLMKAETKKKKNKRQRGDIICYLSKSAIRTSLALLVVPSDSSFEHWKWSSTTWPQFTESPLLNCLRIVKENLTYHLLLLNTTWHRIWCESQSPCVIFTLAVTSVVQYSCFSHGRDRNQNVPPPICKFYFPEECQ